MDDVSTRALAAIVAGEWNTVRTLLHPYPHWTDGSGQTYRGRSNVLAILEQTAQAKAKAQFIELRDGQIYRGRG